MVVGSCDANTGYGTKLGTNDFWSTSGGADITVQLRGISTEDELGIAGAAIASDLL